MEAHFGAVAAVFVALLHAFAALTMALGRRESRVLKRLGGIAGLLGAVLSVAALLIFVSQGAAASTHALGKGWASVRLDGLSLAMLNLVAFIGWVLVRFSQTYLGGNAGWARFMRWLHLTVAAVTVLVVSGDLVTLVAAWIATSFSLHRLLLFNSGRARARVGAKKKHLVARTGDVLLVAAAALIVLAVGSADIGSLNSLTSGADTGPAVWLQTAAWLLVAVAILKCAQFPLHGWLPQILDAPTPVSALLHAGIVNAGGFLIIRLAPVVETSPAAMALLTLVGGVSALFGVCAMAYQSSIKAKLAYSTVSQMGLMLFEIGLGAYELALVHLVAHSLFKAHAFLSAGSWVQRRSRDRRPTPALGALEFVGALGVAALLFAAAHGLLAAELFATTADVVLGGVVILACAHVVAGGLSRRGRPYEVAMSVGAGLLLALAYVAVKAGAHSLLANDPIASSATGLGLSLAVGVVIIAVATLILAVRHTRWGARSDLRRHAYVALRRGLYMDPRFDLLVRAWEERNDANAGRERKPRAQVPARAGAPLTEM